MDDYRHPECEKAEGTCPSDCYELASGYGLEEAAFPIRVPTPDPMRLHGVAWCVIRAWRAGADGCDFVMDPFWRYVRFKTTDDAFRFKLTWL